MKYKTVVVALLLSVFLGGVLLMADNFTRISTDEINANPERLNGYTFRSGELEDIVLKDITLKNVTFDDVKIRSFTAQNVIFINCHFISTRVIGASFEGVKFVGGSFQTRGDFNDPDKRTEFRYIDKFDTIFDDVAFYQPVFWSIKSGNIFLKNIKKYKIDIASAHNLIRGNSLNVRIDNCYFEKSTIVVTHKNSKIYITNTIMRNGAGFSGLIDALYALDCTLEGEIGSIATGVVKNCIMSSRVGGGDVYLIANEYKKRKGEKRYFYNILIGGPKAKFYMLGSKGGNAHIRMPGGSYYLYDVTLENPSITAPDEVTGVQALNLRNVVIKGGKFRKSIVRGGQWENVKIYPEVNIEDANIENIVGYNVTFPEGSPWRGKAKNASMTVSKTPFEWPEIKVPTPEELGLIWDWPEPTGAPPVAQ